MSLTSDLKITATEMHTGGEPLRVIETGFPEVHGETVLEKRRYAKEKLDHLRKFIIFEPRGHYDMYGAIFVKSELPEADFGVLFIHNEGYSTMCGHAVIALGRYAVDRGLIPAERLGEPETEVRIHCPCGLVKCYVEYDASSKRTGSVRFHSIPAFAFALDVTVDVPNYGKVTGDIGYGGAFYMLVLASAVGLDVHNSRVSQLVEAATAITEAVKKAVTLRHPTNDDLAFLYGTILTDGLDEASEKPTANVCVFADREVDRSPTGSGVTARLAVQYHRRQIGIGQKREFVSGTNGSKFVGQVLKETECGGKKAVVIEVKGKAHYSGSATFTLEDDDDLKSGFLLK